MAKKKTKTITFEARAFITVEYEGDVPRIDHVGEAAEQAVTIDLLTEASENEVNSGVMGDKAHITGALIDWESLKPKPRG